MKIPFIICADTVSLLEKIYACDSDQKNSFYQK